MLLPPFAESGERDKRADDDLLDRLLPLDCREVTEPNPRVAADDRQKLEKGLVAAGDGRGRRGIWRRLRDGCIDGSDHGDDPPGLGPPLDRAVVVNTTAPQSEARGRDAESQWLGKQGHPARVMVKKWAEIQRRARRWRIAPLISTHDVQTR
jgi:hypothetical protein